jgi:hypothetical protein
MSDGNHTGDAEFAQALWRAVGIKSMIIACGDFAGLAQPIQLLNGAFMVVGLTPNP